MVWEAAASFIDRLNMSESMKTTFAFINDSLGLDFVDEHFLTTLAIRSLAGTVVAIVLGYIIGRLYYMHEVKKANRPTPKIHDKKNSRKQRSARSGREKWKNEDGVTESEEEIESPDSDKAINDSPCQHDPDIDNEDKENEDPESGEEVILDPDDINYVEDGGTFNDVDPDFVVKNVQARVKQAESKCMWDKLTKDMTADERLAEREAQRKQLETIFAMMETQKEKFGVEDVDDIEQQMKLYM